MPHMLWCWHVDLLRQKKRKKKERKIARKLLPTILEFFKENMSQIIMKTLNGANLELVGLGNTRDVNGLCPKNSPRHRVKR